MSITGQRDCATDEEGDRQGEGAAVKLLTCANLAITMEFIAQLRPVKAQRKKVSTLFGFGAHLNRN